MRVVAKIFRDEIKQTRLLTDVAVGGDAVFRFHSSGAEQCAQRFGILERVGLIDEGRERDTLRTGNVSVSRWVAARGLAGVELRIARIENRNAGLVDIRTDPGSIDHQLWIRMRREAAGFRRTDFRGHLPLLGYP